MQHVVCSKAVLEMSRQRRRKHAAEEAAKTGKETGMERPDEGIRSYAERKCTSGKATVGTYADTCSRVLLLVVLHVLVNTFIRFCKGHLTDCFSWSCLTTFIRL